MSEFERDESIEETQGEVIKDLTEQVIDMEAQVATLNKQLDHEFASVTKLLNEQRGREKRLAEVERQVVYERENVARLEKQKELWYLVMPDIQGMKMRIRELEGRVAGTLSPTYEQLGERLEEDERRLAEVEARCYGCGVLTKPAIYFTPEDHVPIRVNGCLSPTYEQIERRLAEVEAVLTQIANRPMKDEGLVEIQMARAAVKALKHQGDKE